MMKRGGATCDAGTCAQEAAFKCGHCPSGGGGALYCSKVCAESDWEAHIGGRAGSHPNLLQQLWIEHVDYTHMVIVATFRPGLEKDAEHYVNRLIENQRHLADALRGGPELLRLLREHITVAASLLDAFKRGSKADADRITADWRANGTQLADRLDALTGDALSNRALRAAIATHLDQTIAEAAFMLGGNAKDGIRALDEARDHMVAVAGLLALNMI